MNVDKVCNYFDFLCPEEAIRTPTATTNIASIPTSNPYVRLDDFLYSPKSRIPQKVLTSGSACTNTKSTIHFNPPTYYIIDYVEIFKLA